MQTDHTHSWQKLGDPAPGTLGTARQECHWAAQIVSAVGRTHIKTEADDSHSNMGWHGPHRAVISRPVGQKHTCRAALRLADLTLLVLDAADEIRGELALDGRTLDEGYAWMSTALEAPSQGELTGELERPPYEMPPHGLSRGEKFSAAEGAALAELDRWYANADWVLQRVQAAHDGSEVRCWPHHFDIATLITVRKATEDQPGRTIGVGMEPGDGYYSEPYWYVMPYPYPPTPERPSLKADGFWHDDDWIGAVLNGLRMVRAEPQAEQAERVEAFLFSAIAGSRGLFDLPA